jgi:hypothetical protein
LVNKRLVTQAHFSEISRLYLYCTSVRARIGTSHPGLPLTNVHPVLLYTLLDLYT